MLSHGLAAHDPQTEAFVQASLPPHLSYSDFSSSIIPQPPLSNASPEQSLLSDRILHPYNADAFEFLLCKHHLLNSYPLLPRNLRLGFPIGHMPPLSQTIVMPNNPSTISYLDTISDYLTKEVTAGRLSGPFSREVTEQILRGPFQSSSLIVSVQPQEPGVPDKLRVCQHLSKTTKVHASVNSHIRKDDFPTCFDTASKVADIVSLLPFYLFPPFSFLLYTSFLRFVHEDVFIYQCWSSAQSLFGYFCIMQVTLDFSIIFSVPCHQHDDSCPMRRA